MGVPLNQLVKAYKLPFGEVKGVGDLSFINGQIVGPDGKPLVAPAAPQLPAPADPVEAPKKTPKLAAPTREQLRDKHERMLALTDGLGMALKAAVRGIFDAQRDAVLKAVAASGEGEKPSRAALGIDTEKSAKQLAEAMAPHVKVGVYSGRDLESRLIRDAGGKSCPPASRKAQARIDKWVSNKSFGWAEEMNKATLKRIDKIIEDSLAAGESLHELNTRLAEAFDAERDYRTERVAQTEMVAALNEGSLEAYRENESVGGKGWLATEDEVTRPDHRVASERYDDKHPIGVDEEFVVGDARGATPGQTGDPSQDINCRCTIFPVVISKEAQ
jgi:uncharacterized protein with gpF-like domain